MSTRNYYPRGVKDPKDAGLTSTRSIIETAFYRNNVTSVSNVMEAYNLAKKSPGTIITDQPIYMPEALGLPKDAKVLVFNDGSITGRFKPARRIVGESETNQAELNKILMDAVYDTRYKNMYHAEAVIGLDRDFMVKAHLLLPEGEENLLLNWMLNFQDINHFYSEEYKASLEYYHELDIYVFGFPQWKGTNQTDVSDPNCLAFFDPKSNCAAILGMRYFGEFKKGTLTLAWALAERNGFVSCHGGQKKFEMSDGSIHVASFFGLSGSGKSTLTHAKGENCMTTVLHDDAFIINTENGSSIALEPAYFDKTADYPVNSPDNKYLLTLQNVAVTRDAEGKLIPVTYKDLRNGNGRAIKSFLWSPNRVNKIQEPANSIFWIMKDPTLPPVLKILRPELASAMGATLATKRSTAERLKEGVDINALVYEPYANPFRCWPLTEDYTKFKELIRDRNVECYIINTGEFMGRDIPKEVTLGVIEAISDKKAEFKEFGPFDELLCMEFDGFQADFGDPNYVKKLKNSLESRVEFLESLTNDLDELPKEAEKSIRKLLEKI